MTRLRTVSLLTAMTLIACTIPELRAQIEPPSPAPAGAVETKAKSKKVKKGQAPMAEIWGKNLMGIGMNVQKKGKKMVILKPVKSSPADEAGIFIEGISDEIYLLSVTNASRNIVLTVGKKTTTDDVMNAVIATEGESVIIQFKRKSEGKPTTLTIGHYFVDNRNLSSTAEKLFLQTHAAQYMAPDEKPLDTDGDGLADGDDKCPNEEGPASNTGCPNDPDSDGDGVADEVDNCPDVAGDDGHGCPPKSDPLADRDGDGVMDFLDGCPDVPGSSSNWGCPEKKTEAPVSTGNNVLFCTNLMKIVNDFPNEFKSVKGAELSSSVEDEKQYGVNNPLPGIPKQYFEWVTFAGLTLFDYTGEYRIDTSMEAAKIHYNELLSMVNQCDLKPAVWSSEESGSNEGELQKAWKITEYPGGLTSKYEKFVMSVEIDKSYDDGKTTYKVFLCLARVL